VGGFGRRSRNKRKRMGRRRVGGDWKEEQRKVREVSKTRVSNICM
jgi:hypothetical protein